MTEEELIPEITTAPVQEKPEHTKPEFDPGSAIFTPQESVAAALKTVRYVRQGYGAAGISLGLRYISSGEFPYVPRVLPGQTAVILAQTSHGKSYMMHYIERKAAYQLITDGREDEVLIHVSVEESIEEQVYNHLSYRTGVSAGDIARGAIQDWNMLEQEALVVGQIPIYRIGEAIARPEATPHLYMSNMLRCIDFLREKLMGHRLKIAGIFFDYLQAFPIDPEVARTALNDQRRLQVREDFYRIRQAARRFGCPTFVAVQAKQELKDAPGKDMLTPGQYDVNETADVSQRADRIFSLWMPKQTHSVGARIDHKGFSFTVEENLMFFKVCKQRGGHRAGKAWAMRVDFNSGTIAVLENITDVTTPESKLEFM